MSQTVPRWGRFETTVENPRPCADPFASTALDAVFTGPDGRRVEIQGFYAGDAVWKLRFMPDRVGRWTYAAAFADGAPGTSGAFDCVPSDLPGLVQTYAANPTWFGFKDGGPFLPRSLHVGDCFFADGPNAETGDDWGPDLRIAFLDWAQAQGYNTLSVAGHYLRRDSEGRGRGWNSPVLWDGGTQQPDPAAYDRLEAALDELARRRFAVYPFAGFFGRNAVFPAQPAEQELYIRYTLARLAPYWNLLFNLGGPEPHQPSNPYLTRDDINRLGRLIARHDPYGHLLSVHNPTGDDCFGQEDWVGYITLQGPKTVERARLAEAHRRNGRPGKPLYAQETLWPGNGLHRRSAGRDYSLDDIRKNAWVMLFSGAAINFADMDGLSSSGFSGRPEVGRQRQEIHDAIKAVWDLFETLPYPALTPRPELADAGYCLADAEARTLLIYLDAPGTVRLDGKGAYAGEWIDPSRPQQRRPTALANAGSEALETPAGDDWLLFLKAV